MSPIAVIEPPTTGVLEPVFGGVGDVVEGVRLGGFGGLGNDRLGRGRCHARRAARRACSNCAGWRTPLPSTTFGNQAQSISGSRIPIGVNGSRNLTHGGADEFLLLLMTTSSYERAVTSTVTQGTPGRFSTTIS